MNYFQTKSVRCVSRRFKEIVCERQNNQCNGCGDLLECTREVDHRNPLWRGGSNSLNNLQALCPNCHARKSRVEQQAIPRRYAGSPAPSYRKCPLCEDIVSAYFPHACPLFEIVRPGSFRLYPSAKGPEIARLGRFVFDAPQPLHDNGSGRADPDAAS